MIRSIAFRVLCPVLVCTTAFGFQDGGLSFPSDAIDMLGETLGGISAVEVMGPGRMIALSDRGPGDGAVDFRPRLHVFSMDGVEQGKTPVLQKTILLLDEQGKPFTGLLPDSSRHERPIHADGRSCIDPEGLVVASDGRFFISEEYGPTVMEFSPEGKLLRRFETPGECVPKGHSGIDYGTDDAGKLVSGREPNRGFEGLAMLPDGKSLAAILQSGLIQDGGRKAPAVRLVVFDIASGRATAAYAVPSPDVDDINLRYSGGKEVKRKHIAYSSLTALPDGRLLALERDNFGANGNAEYEPAKYKAIILLDTRRADNILGKDIRKSTKPVGRTTLANFAEDVRTRPGGDEMPAKWEGIALLESTRNQAVVMVSSDNDYLHPMLRIERNGAIVDLPLPQAEVPQPTRMMRIELPIPSR